MASNPRAQETAEKLYTIDQAARLLREYAEMTARASQNWDNYQRIAETALAGAFEAGKASTHRDAGRNTNE